jgi:PPK2 family polyphosphate:nucleotide phosphotransferase
MKSFRLEPGSQIKLKDLDPSSTGDTNGGKKEGLDELKGLLKELDTLQELLYAEHKHKVLIVVQAMDTGGKDGTIRRVFEGVNPSGVRVASFKVPTPLESDHDFLWRSHWQMPGSGEMVIFNRSHYEDVLVVRVHKLVPARVWQRRYKEINDFERMLSQEGTLILKFFLNISLEEQKKRLQERLEDETKTWKFNPDDLKERALWKDYMQAYEDVLNKTSTEYAPWYVVPSDHKWFRDLVVADAIVRGLKQLKMQYPKPTFDLAEAMQAVENLA